MKFWVARVGVVEQYGADKEVVGVKTLLNEAKSDPAIHTILARKKVKLQIWFFSQTKGIS